MNSESLDDGSTLYSTEGGLIQSFPVGGSVVYHARRGIIGVEFADAVIHECERALQRSGRCVLMVDGQETKMHTTEFRERLTDWFRGHETATVHMLIRSRMLEMALNVSNLVLGGRRARAYHGVDEWEAAGRAAHPSFRRLKLVAAGERKRSAG